MGVRKIGSEVEGEEKPFCQTPSPFHFLGEAVLQWGAWVPADGSCDTGDEVCQVLGSKIKTSMNSQGKTSPISQSALCVCLCCWVSAAKGLPESRPDPQTRGYVGPPEAIWGRDASLLGPERNHHYILIIHLGKTPEKAEEEYQALLPLMAVAWRMS